MKKREKIVLGGIMAGMGTLLNLFFTAALHGMLSGRMKSLALVPIGECISGLFTEQRQGMLFLAFEGFVALCCILFFVQNSKAYQSNLMKVTDEIQIPVPVGQYQHGSSRWMREEEKDKVFQVCMINPTDPIIRQLIDTGYEGLDFMRDTAKADAGAAGGQGDRESSDGAVSIDQDAGQETGEGKEEGTKEEQREEERGKEEQEKEDKKAEESYETVAYVWQKQESRPDASARVEKPADNGQDPYRILKEGGVVIGMSRHGKREKIHYIGDDTHTLTIGATRSGKTRTLVLQSVCLMALAGESLVISDPKAELYQYTAPFLEKLGYDVICLDFKNPEKSSRYNLLQPIIDAVNKGETDKAEMYAWDITNILVGDNTSNEKIWENGEKSTIAAAILSVVVDNTKRPEYQNLTNVYWFVAEMCKAVGNKTPMQEYVKCSGQAFL